MTGVSHFETQPVAGCAGADADCAGRAPGGDPMNDGILHERLQQQRRHDRLPRGGVDLITDLQPVREAHPLIAQ